MADPVWEVSLAGARVVARARSHQAAKRTAIEHWVSCNGDPIKYRKALMARIAEKWRGGIRARKIRTDAGLSSSDQAWGDRLA